MEYPKSLYGPKGWGDLNDHKVAHDADQEAEWRALGYKMLNEPETAPEPKEDEKQELTDEDKAAIVASDEKANVLAEKYGVPWQTIAAIRRAAK